MALIMLVEDDHIISAALSRALTDAGNAVHPFGRASDALRVLTTERPDLVILDLGLPDIDGADALRMIRAVSDVPVIIATARRAERDIISLLHAGADDYVTKPFSAAQLLARIAAVLRRNRPPAVEDLAPPIVVGGLSISLDQHQASIDGRPLQLTRREFELLAYLAQRVDRVVTRRELMTEVWHQPQFGEEQTIDVHISWLRRKLGETAARPRFLRTVRGVGVMMVSQP